MSYRFLIVAAALGMVTACAGRMTADEYDRQFKLGISPPSAVAAPEDAQDTDQARRLAARRYLDASISDLAFDNMLHESAKELPDGQRAEFFRLAKQVLSREKLDELLLRQCMKYFTRRQLNAFTDFFQSPAGRSIASRGFQLSGPAVPTEGPGDTPEDRRVAALRLVSEVDFMRLYGELMRVTARRLSSTEDREVFLWQAARDYPDFERQMMSAFEKYRTRSEIDALARFYRTREGGVMFVQFPSMMDEFMSYIVQVLRREGLIKR